jgi:large subunit ribosomal protein L21
VETTVLKHYRGKKILVYKMKPKKKTRKKRGHRQELTRLLVHSITLDGTILASHEAENRKLGAILSDPLPSMALPDGD